MKNAKSQKIAIFPFFYTKNVTKFGCFGPKTGKIFVHPLFLMYLTIERVKKINRKMCQ